jgi:hypothetical protein
MTKRDWDRVGHCSCGSDKLFSFVNQGCHIRCLDCGHEACGHDWNICITNWKANRPRRKKRRQERPILSFGRRKLKGGATRIVGRSSSQG